MCVFKLFTVISENKCVLQLIKSHDKPTYFPYIIRLMLTRNLSLSNIKEFDLTSL
jgi:hypothetical protein